VLGRRLIAFEKPANHYEGADEMFIAIVQIPIEKRSKQDAVKAAKGSAPTFRGAPGLIRKYYLNGDAGGGGVYLWESREAAEAWYNDDWWRRAEKSFGVRPTVTYYDNYVVVDNANGEVRVDGEPVTLEPVAVA
jgi:heme-degrading monooxygenase HmoA